MQLNISAVEVLITNTTKLFFLPKAPLLERYNMLNMACKNLIISTLCLMPCALPVQAGTEDTAVPTINTATVATPTTNSATPAATATPATNTATPAATATPATNSATPAATATPATNSATPAEAIATRPATEIANLIASKQHPYLTQSDFTRRVDDLDALYSSTAYKPIWLADESKAAKNIGEVVQLLESAANHGLNTADYDTALLKEKLAALKLPYDAQSKDLALYDTAISLSLLRFMHDLHYGRVNPRSLALNYDIKQRTETPLDLAALIKTSLAENNLSKLAELAEPKLPQYKKLQQQLATYSLADKSTFNLTIKSAIQAGNPLPQSAELQQYLVMLGDLSADKVDNAATTYTDNIVEAVKKFQQRNGIKANGIINKTTAAAFNKRSTSAQHITQIELAMERLRWLPEISQGPAIMVNIPAFQLFAFDDIQQDSPTKTMRVVVGKSAKHQTPLLTADMLFVDFHPFWNVPFKIARDEILPKLADNPDYLAGHNMEVVSRSGKKLGSDAWAYADQIRQGSFAIRQKPGSKNALGKVKFIFPNKNDVYLHDTPSVSLFARGRRDLSHGCVRVAEPQELANFVLKNEGEWDSDTIKKAMKGARNQRITLKNAIPVFFLYNTAFFNENNNLSFYSDIYGQDEKLIAALKKPREDLSDQKLFAPKEVTPPTETPSTHQIEASHVEPVTTANAKQAPMIEAANTKPIAPAIEAVAVTESKPNIAPTASP